MSSDFITGGLVKGSSSIIGDHPDMLLAKELIDLLKARQLDSAEIWAVTVHLVGMAGRELQRQHRPSPWIDDQLAQVERRMDQYQAASERAASGADFKIILGGK